MAKPTLKEVIFCLLCFALGFTMAGWYHNAYFDQTTREQLASESVKNVCGHAIRNAKSVTFGYESFTVVCKDGSSHWNIPYK